MTKDITNPARNNLRQARKRRGLERKQVAFLLERKSTDEISRYEKGEYLPSLRTALLLEAIYQMPIRLLFQAMFDEYRTEILRKTQEHPHLFPDNRWFPKHADQLRQEEYCFFSELLRRHIPNQLELEIVNKHVVSLVNTSSDFKNGKNPFSEH